MTRRLTLPDRLAAAAVGAVVGGLVGFAMAWILGVYSNTLGPARMPVNFMQWVVFCAAGFGAIGLLLGPFVGTLLGTLINLIFRFEQAGYHDDSIPAWMVVVLVACILAGAWWFAA